MAYLGAIRRCPSPRIAHSNFYEKSTGTVYGRLVQATPSVAGTFTLKQCSRLHQNTPFLFRELEGHSSLSRPDLPREGSPRPLPHPPSLGAYGASTLVFSALNRCPLPKSYIRHCLSVHYKCSTYYYTEISWEGDVVVIRTYSRLTGLRFELHPLYNNTELIFKKCLVSLITFGSLLSQIRLSSVTFVCPAQGLKRLAIFLAILYRIAILRPPCKILRRSSHGKWKPLRRGLNARGTSKIEQCHVWEFFWFTVM